MINNDKKEKFDNEIAMVEYLASFWNSEAVKKIQEQRDKAAAHRFKTDEEFEKDLVSGDYKNNPLIEAIKKINKAKSNNKKTIDRNRSPKTKLPTDLSSIINTVRKFD